MNKRFVISVVALFVASMVLGMVVHGMLPGADYAKLVASGVFRSEQDSQKQFPWMILAHALLAVGLILGIVAAAANRDPLPARA